MRKHQCFIVAVLAAVGLALTTAAQAQLTTNVVERTESDSFPLSRHHAEFEKYEQVQLSPRLCRADPQGAYVVKIASQDDFDRMQSLVTSALKSHKDVLVSIAAGTYTFRQNHLDLTGVKAKGRNLFITGQGDVRVIGASTLYEATDPRAKATGTCWQLPDDTPWSHTTAYTDGEQLLPVAGSDGLNGGRLVELEELIEVVDSTAKVCRAKLPARFAGLEKSAKECRDIYMKVTTWYVGEIVKVDRIKGGYVYFTFPNLGKGYETHWNINNDCGFNIAYYDQPRNPRIQLLNLDADTRGISVSDGHINVPQRYGRVYECTNTVFLKTGDTELANLDISGITFTGNGGAGGEALLWLGPSKTTGLITIHDNRFIGIMSKVVHADTPDVSVYDNSVSHTYTWAIYGTNAATRFCVFHNDMEELGEQINNTFAIYAGGTDYYIARNTLKNFTYGGIGVGVWFGHPAPNDINGIVEYNKMYWDDDYLALQNNRGLMDSGAIYVWTKNKRAIIRYNWIHNYGGTGANRGIFCDDGVQNAAIYGNVVAGVVTSLCIDLRSVTSIAKQVPDHNEGNCIMYNIIDGRYLFYGKENVDNNVQGENIIVYSDSYPKRRLKFFDQPENDFYVKGEITRDLIKVRRGFAINRSSLPLSPEITRCILGEYY